MLYFFMKNQSRQPRFESDIRPEFPSVSRLLEQAEKCNNSCIHADQVMVNRNFFKSVAVRGAYSKKYTLDEIKKASILLDYMAETKARDLYRMGSEQVSAY